MKELAAKTDAQRAELIEAAKKSYHDAVIDLPLRKRGQIVPEQPAQRLGGEQHGEFHIEAADVRWIFPSEEAKKQGVEEGKRRIDEAKQNIEDMQTVAVVLPTNNFDYIQKPPGLNWIGVFQGRVKQIVDDHDMIMQQFMDGLPDIWIEGVSTSGLIDNEIVGGPNAQTPGISIWVNGTKQYDTALGSTRTILKAVSFEISKYIQK